MSGRDPVRVSAPLSFGSMRVKTPHCEPGQRIGLLGGSFNPAHAAHRLNSAIALKHLGLDRVWWVVTPSNPLKSPTQQPSLAARMTAAKSVARDARITVTGFEASLPSRYTAATLAFLRRRHPGVRFVWLMGADCLADFHRWQQWRSIFRVMPIAVIDRPGWHLRALAGPAARAFARHRLPEDQARTLACRHAPAWTFLTGPLSSLSSTALRENYSAATGRDG